MNNDELLKALGRFTPQQIADALARQKQEETTRVPQQDSDSASDSDVLLERQLLPLNAFTTEDSFSEASFDRQMLRQLLDELKLADLHKWWDGTQYRINNDWLFTDLKEIEIELVNKNQESKFFRLKVSL